MLGAVWNRNKRSKGVGTDLDEEVDGFDRSLELGGRAVGLLEWNKVEARSYQISTQSQM